MQYPQSERQRAIIDLATDLAQAIAPRASEADRTGSLPRESYEELVHRGYQALTVPAELGGMGGSMLEFVLAQHALARGDEAVALGINMHLMSVANANQSRTWPQALYRRVMHEVVHEGALINSAAAEPEMGSPAGGGRPRTIARRVTGGWLIEGRKTFTSLSPVLRYFIVLATIGETERGVEVGQFLVRNNEHVRIDATWDVMSMRSTASDDIIIEQAFVPDGDVISRRLLAAPSGPAPGGAYFALGVGGVYLGIAAAARDFAISFARDRTPTGLGRPVGTIQSVQHRLARMDVLLLAAQELLFGAADDWSNALTERQRVALGPKVAAAKYLVTNNAIEVVDLAMRIVGGVALFRSHPLERYYRNVRAGLSHPPIDDRALDLIARAALGFESPAAAGTP
jgi:alkylation response protein AidB-like acyl-CoA dehydrogenase